MFEDSFARLRVELRFLFLLSACVRHCRLVLSHHLKHISIDLLQIQFLLRKFLKILASLLLNTRLVLLPLFVLLFVELGDSWGCGFVLTHMIVRVEVKRH